MTKIVVLGGSAVSTPQLAAALADAGPQAIELALVGRSRSKLTLVAAAARRAGRGAIPVSEHTDPEPALEDAAVVLSQVRVGGLQGRAFDERFPRDFGIPGEETVGPGGFSSAWRTLPVVQELMGHVHRIVPDALVLNLTNPASMVHMVAERAGLATITLCDAPVVLAQRLGVMIGADPAATRPRYAGMNHCGWITGLEVGGADRLSEALARAEDVARLTGVDAQVIEWLRAIPNPYLRYLYHPERQLAAQQAKETVRATELEDLERQALDEYARGEDLAAATARRPAPWYAECVVPLIRSVLAGERVRTIVDVTNDGLLPFLPPATTIEIAADVEGGVVEPLPIDPLPIDAQAILAQLAAYDELSVNSILDGDRQGCVRALASHPLVRSIDMAAELVQRIERQNGPLLGGRP